MRKALDKALAGYPNIDVQDQSDFVAQTKSQVNQIVTIINILLGLSVIIALLGVINTLALSVIERTRELGLLRAVGMARRQVKRMIRVEPVLICSFGGLLGLVVGSIFGVALQQALKGAGRHRAVLPGGDAGRSTCSARPSPGRSRRRCRPAERLGSTCCRRSRRSRSASRTSGGCSRGAPTGTPTRSRPARFAL